MKITITEQDRKGLEHHDKQLAFKIMERARLPEQDGHFDCERIHEKFLIRTF